MLLGVGERAHGHVGHSPAVCKNGGGGGGSSVGDMSLHMGVGGWGCAQTVGGGLPPCCHRALCDLVVVGTPRPPSRRQYGVIVRRTLLSLSHQPPLAWPPHRRIDCGGGCRGRGGVSTGSSHGMRAHPRAGEHNPLICFGGVQYIHNRSVRGPDASPKSPAARPTVGGSSSTPPPRAPLFAVASPARPALQSKSRPPPAPPRPRQRGRRAAGGPGSGAVQLGSPCACGRKRRGEEEAAGAGRVCGAVCVWGGGRGGGVQFNALPARLSTPPGPGHTADGGAAEPPRTAWRGGGGQPNLARAPAPPLAPNTLLVGTGLGGDGGGAGLRVFCERCSQGNFM